MIRVLHYVGAMEIGGAENLIMQWYRNIDTDIVQFDFLVHNTSQAFFDEEIMARGGKIWHLQHRLSNIQEYRKEIKCFFKNHPEYKIVHCHQNELSGYLIEVAKSCKVSVVIAHSHNLLSFNHSIRDVIKWYGRVQVLRYADYIFACSIESLRTIYRKKADNDRFYVLKNGIEADKFAYDKKKGEQIRAQYGISSDDFLIGTVGNLRDYKNHRFIIPIVHSLQQHGITAHLLIVGEGDERPNLMRAAREYGIENYIHLVGNKSNVQDYLSAFDCFVFPSLFEGLGIGLIEAQANGLPCVASDRVPREACCNEEQVRFIGISDQDISAWVDAIITAKRRSDPAQALQIVAEAGYDIRPVAAWLQQFYLKAANHE